MSVVMDRQEVAPEICMGDTLSREEFLSRWEAIPGLRFAELLEGVVFMPSPLSRQHSDYDDDLGTWLAVYRAATPGCRRSSNATWLMGEDSAPQPDLTLRILPEYGGQSRAEGNYLAGAPELAAEICVSSATYDLHHKLAVYEVNGVQEYLAVVEREARVRWHRRVGSRLQLLDAPPDGVYRSVVFPGLWLDAAALLAGDLARVLTVLQQGLATPEHAAFRTKLAVAKQRHATEGT